MNYPETNRHRKQQAFLRNNANFRDVRLSFAMIVLGILLAPQIAEAGLFEGFTKEGQYKRKGALCEALTPMQITPKCKTLPLDSLSRIKTTMGTEHSGASLLKVKTSASTIELWDTEKKIKLFSWDTGEILGKMGTLYLHSNGWFVALEYAARFAGKQRQELVVFALPHPILKSTVQESEKINKVAEVLNKTEVTSNVPSKEFLKALQKAKRLAKRRRYKKANQFFLKALQILPGHPETLYWLARSQYKAKNRSAALSSLETLAGSTHPDALIWKVEARFDIVFKSLRLDKRFRFAVGIEYAKGQQPTLYERLVAFGGQWEQESIPCEQPQVNLRLKRGMKHKFDLIIRSKCQGSRETTRLDGSWQIKNTSGKNDFGLKFPNTDSEDDDLSCQLEVCTDEPGEECLRCQPGDDLEFLLRAVRR